MLDRFTHLLKSFSKQRSKSTKDKALFNARQEVDINGNGTNGYVIKSGPNRGKVLGHTTRSKPVI